MGKIITISQKAMQYMSTGRFRAYYDKETSNLVLEDWREIFRVLISKGVESVEVDIDAIRESFGPIYSFFEDGLFKTGDDIVNYFECLGDVENEDLTKEMSHNAMLYRVCLEKNDLDSVHKREVCSTKITDTKSNKTWGLGGVYENLKINRNHFNKYVKGDYILTHGNSLLGLIAVKELKKEEFEKQKKWYENVHKNTKNPFIKHKKEVELLLKE